MGVLIEGKVYLFDPLLGLPIPAPDGVKLDESGQLAIQPATLAQVVADDKLLRRMDDDESHAYCVKASDLKRVTVLLEASPAYLARPMKAIQSQLSGTQRMVLSTSPTALAERWKAAHVEDARLWLQPFVTLYQRRTWIGGRRNSGSRTCCRCTWFTRRSRRLAAKTSMLPKGLEVGVQEAKGPQVVEHAAPLQGPCFT